MRLLGWWVLIMPVMSTVVDKVRSDPKLKAMLARYAASEPMTEGAMVAWREFRSSMPTTTASEALQIADRLGMAVHPQRNIVVKERR